jgi:SPP1 family phage portal protein
VYDAREYVQWEKLKNGEWILTPVSVAGKDESGKDIEGGIDGNGDKVSGIHLYGAVPVLEANVDRDKRNLFDPILPLLDAFDKLISEQANEHDKFADSIMLLADEINSTTPDENGFTDLDKIKLLRIMQKLGEKIQDKVGYLERHVDDNFIEHTLDRWERLLYEMLCLFNPNDQSFGLSSGQYANAFKLLGFELNIADIESYFSKFLQARIKLISGHELFEGKSWGKEEGPDFITIHFERNLPFDLQTMATIASVLAGGEKVLDSETILSLFPSTVIKDKDDVLERLKAEKQATSNPLGIDAPPAKAEPKYEEGA